MKGQFEKISWRKFFICIMTGLLLGFLIEWITTTDFCLLRGLIEHPGTRIQYDNKEKFVLSNCHLVDHGIITDSDDAWLEIEDIDAYVDYLDIKLASSVSCSWQLGVLAKEATDTGEWKNVEVSRWISRYEKGIILSLQSRVKCLRIYLGNEENLFFPMDSVIVNPSWTDYLQGILIRPFLTRMFLYAGLLFFLGLLLTGIITFESLFAHRWLMGGIIFLICIFFQLNASSIPIYNRTLPGYRYKPLWGYARSVRSDEFNLFTQMAFSQVSSDFPWFSDLYRATPTDMALIYGQPIKNPIIMFFRFFQIGYIWFGAAGGLSFYWCSRFILCFLVSIEFGRLITDDRKVLATAYAVLVSMAPVVQWWFSTNCLVEILIYGQGAVLLLYLFMNHISIKKKIILIAGMIVCAGGYILTLYPAWQIPFFYVFLTCAICVIIKKIQEEGFCFSKADILLIAGGILITGFCMIYIFIKSYETIVIEANTVYPGSRNVLGGDLSQIFLLFRSWSNVFLPFTTKNLGGNQCEAAGFYDFFPLGILIGIAVLIKNKDKDPWIISLGICGIILGSFVLFQWPESLAKITLLNNCTIVRLIIPIGFLNLILLFRGVARIQNVQIPIAILFVSAIVICYFNYYYDWYQTYLTIPMKLIVGILVVLGVCLFAGSQANGQKNILIFSIILVCISSGVINPINSGVDFILDNPVVRNIKKINDERPGTWVVVGDIMYNNLPTTVGASTLNSIQNYPDYQLWTDLGFEEETMIWNRYSYFEILLSEKNHKHSDLELYEGAWIRLTTNIDTLKDIGVNYILSKEQIETEKTAIRYQCGDFCIYEIN